MNRALALLPLLLLAGCFKGIGDRCNEDSDCDEVRGYCARVNVCTRECGPELGDCPQGSSCVLQETRLVCLKSCGGDDDCNSDERCRETPVDVGESARTRVCTVNDPLKEL